MKTLSIWTIKFFEEFERTIATAVKLQQTGLLEIIDIVDPTISMVEMYLQGPREKNPATRLLNSFESIPE